MNEILLDSNGVEALAHLAEPPVQQLLPMASERAISILFLMLAPNQGPNRPVVDSDDGESKNMKGAGERRDRSSAAGKVES
jgi:hypothetical protein